MGNGFWAFGLLHRRGRPCFGNETFSYFVNKTKALAQQSLASIAASGGRQIPSNGYEESEVDGMNPVVIAVIAVVAVAVIVAGVVIRKRKG